MSLILAFAVSLAVRYTEPAFDKDISLPLPLFTWIWRLERLGAVAAEDFNIIGVADRDGSRVSGGVEADGILGLDGNQFRIAERVDLSAVVTRNLAGGPAVNVTLQLPGVTLGLTLGMLAVMVTLGLFPLLRTVRTAVWT